VDGPRDYSPRRGTRLFWRGLWSYRIFLRIVRCLSTYATSGKAWQRKQLVAGSRVTDLGDLLFAENCRFVFVIFEFQEIMKGVFQKKREMFESRIGVAPPGLLIESQAFRLGRFHHRLPIFLRGEYEAEMSRVDSFLRSRQILYEVSDKLMASEFERDRGSRSPADSAA
jgi:hypothetical protein